MTRPAGAPLAPGGRLDPALSGRLLAFAELEAGRSSVVVLHPDGTRRRFPDAAAPALDGAYLAYADAAGVRVVRWSTGEEVARVAGPVGKPAIEWPLLAVVRDVGAARLLEVRNLLTGGRRVVTRAGRTDDLGRPAMRARRIAWHHTRGNRSRVFVQPVGGGPTLLVAESSSLDVNPSLSRTHVAWVHQRDGRGELLVRRLDGDRARRVLAVGDRDALLLTTALGRREAYVTRWSMRTLRARLLRARLTPR